MFVANRAAPRLLVTAIKAFVGTAPVNSWDDDFFQLYVCFSCSGPIVDHETRFRKSWSIADSNSFSLHTHELWSNFIRPIQSVAAASSSLGRTDHSWQDLTRQQPPLAHCEGMVLCCGGRIGGGGSKKDDDLAVASPLPQTCHPRCAF